ncbi:MAG: hypothetical protein KAJ19_12025 [Gammaproteobacteria bacterium]|nr:hypothetical protein [Gammaproteobacteria bacterium]
MLRLARALAGFVLGRPAVLAEVVRVELGFPAPVGVDPFLWIPRTDRSPRFLGAVSVELARAGPVVPSLGHLLRSSTRLSVVPFCGVGDATAHSEHEERGEGPSQKSSAAVDTIGNFHRLGVAHKRVGVRSCPSGNPTNRFLSGNQRTPGAHRPLDRTHTQV